MVRLSFAFACWLHNFCLEPKRTIASREQRVPARVIASHRPPRITVLPTLEGPPLTFRFLVPLRFGKGYSFHWPCCAAERLGTEG